MSRATSPSSSRRSSYQAVSAVRKRGARTRRTGELSLAAPGLDLAARLRVFQRELRRRLERHDALLDIVRALSTTLEPVEIADLLVERAAAWMPAPSWAVVSSDLSARLQVIAGRGLTPEMGPAILADLMQAGTVTPVIDRSYKLSEVPEAIRSLEQGHARGKVVINLEWRSRNHEIVVDTCMLAFHRSPIPCLGRGARG